MSFPTLLLIALGVSADAFAVALGKGLQLRRLGWREAVEVAATFGAFQGLMPLIGYLLGRTLREELTAFDHWIAFALLAAIGLKMIWEAIRPDKEGEEGVDGIAARELLILGLATSIDALAVGISFAFLDVVILEAVLLIGATTFAVALGGVYLGHRAGSRFRGPAEVLGGLILIAIGTRILVQHLSGG